MRPKTFDFDPANASLTGFLSNATGATWTLSATSSGDDLAHQVSIRNDTANDHSAKTAILTGTDSDGRAQTETVTLPAGSATVESTKYFLTLTTVVPSATIGADTMDIGWVDEFSSKTIPLDHYSQNPASVQVTVTGTINFDVETTMEDPFSASITDQSTLDWLNDANFTAKTSSLANNLAMTGSRAMRFVVNSYTDTAELQAYITQSR